MNRLPALFVVSFLCSHAAHAEEGMWLFNDFPSADVKKSLNVTVDQKWLDRVRLGALRLANGCSASMVSAQGLVMTNHHCIRSCLEQLSTKERDLLTSPFLAATTDKEEKCAGVEAHQLVSILDVTDKILAATKDAQGADYMKNLRAEQSRLENECTGGDVKKRCDVVTLFNGARFHLYAYRRFQDLRMVFAPEFDMAAFGGDPDNFNFPRYGTDMAFLRIWEDGKPFATKGHLKFAKVPAKDGDPVFVAGNPGGTERNRTVAELEFQRDVALPWTLMRLSELRGRMDVWMQGDAERRRIMRSKLRAVENGLKALRGRFDAVVAPGFLDGKRATEADLRSKAPEHSRGAWDDIASAMATQRTLWGDFRMLEGAEAFTGDLFAYARMLVRMADESAKPDAERLPEYMPSRLPIIRQQLTAPAPVHKDLERAVLTWSLTRFRNLRGVDDPAVKMVLGRKSPEALAEELVNTTQLHDQAFRTSVMEGKTALDADPMLVFARSVDAASRASRKAMEERVEALVKKANEKLSEARRAVIGTSGYPDATFSLRLSYGTVKGYGAVPAMTRVGNFYERLTGAFPLAAAPTWLAAQSKMPANTPFNVATTNDIIGGNSGSPLLNKDGEVVGLVFDGNMASQAGNFGYDGRENRTVAVHGELMTTALEKVYGATALLKELRGK